MAGELATLSNYSQSVYYRNFWATKVYLILTYNAIYTRYYNSSAGEYIYRPNGLTAYWTAGPDAPGITVSSMYVGYGTTGNLVPFPECNNVSNLSNIVIQTNYGMVL